MEISGIQWVSNYERNRWFLVLQVERPADDGLNTLLHTSNAVAEAFGQPPLYAKARDNRTGKHVQKIREASSHHRRDSDGKRETSDAETQEDMSSCFHISIAWTLNHPTSEMRQGLEKLMEGKDMHLNLKVSAVKAKVGNAVTSFSFLAAKKDTSNGII